MRFGIMATGGVGGYFGGLLARAGKEVCFIARGKHLETLQSEGLRVDSLQPGPFTVKKALFTDDPAKAGHCDVILFCVKTPANPLAIPAIDPMVGPESVIVTLQNGVDNPDQLAAAYGWERVMGGAVYIFTGIDAPGVVKQTGGACRLVFGEMKGGSSNRGEKILQILKSSKINAELSADIRAEMWQKFILICGVSGMTALTRLPLGDILAYDGTARMMRELLREVYSVGRSLGIQIPDAMDEQCFTFASKLSPSSKGSLCHDLEAGRRLEIDALFGIVSRFGKEKNIPTPINDYLYHTLKLSDLKATEQL